MKNVFEIASWDEAPYLELDSGAKYSSAKISKIYSGVMVGTASLDYLMAYNPSGEAHFTGIEHFEGTIDNKQGTVSILHNGTFADGSVTSTFHIISGSQTGELIGIEGKGSYTTSHSLIVEFEFNYSADQ